MWMLQLLGRTNSILSATLIGVIGHALLFITLPIRLENNGVSTGLIGLAMSCYSIGTILSCIFGSRLITRVGHIRAFSVMSAVISVLAITHGYVDSVWFVALMRLLFGYAITTNFIIMESWLTGLSTSTTRGRIFSTYQISYGLGGIIAPFILHITNADDPRLFGLIAICFCVSLIPLGLTNRPVPSFSEDTKKIPIKQLWSISSVSVVGMMCAGLVTLSTISLTPVYANSIVATHPFFVITIVLASFYIGSMIFQFPVGWLADTINKQALAIIVSAVGALANVSIVLSQPFMYPDWLLIASFVLASGMAACMYPLAYAHMFERIKNEDILPIMSKMMLLYGIFSVLGQQIGGFLMEILGNAALYMSIAVVHVIYSVYVFWQSIFNRKRLYKETSVQMITQVATHQITPLNPAYEYQLTDILDPEIKLLAQAISFSPEHAAEFIYTAFENNRLQPEDVAQHLVLLLPRCADTIIQALTSNYPDRRILIAQSLHDILILRKQRVNQLITDSLIAGASPQEQQSIQDIIDDAETIITQMELAEAADEATQHNNYAE